MALKIGILTLPLVDNYGGILQAVSLYKLLKKEGNEVVLIHHAPEIPRQTFLHKFIKKVLLTLPFQNIGNIKGKQKLLEKRKEIIDSFNLFITKEIDNISEKLYTRDDLINFTKQEKFDAIIVGSDQVWRKSYIKNSYYKSFFLEFVNSKYTKKIAYAASFGKDLWEGENDSLEISKLLNDFTSVSVRERSAIEICRKTFNYEKAINTLDPTLLNNKNFYLEEIVKKYSTTNILKNSLTTYVLDEANEKKEVIDFVHKKIGTDNIHHLKGFKNTDKTYSLPEWIDSILKASFVVTDSFHGMVFSIIFEKDFLVIGNKSRGLDRFKSLTSILDLEDRVILDISDLKKLKLNSIDYNIVNKKLNEEIIKSLNFLKESLNAK